MALTVEQIRSAGSDEELLKLLGGELRQLFPPELRNDPVVFLSRLHAAPAGLRAMATTYELDVSMTVDDLAWHFMNYHSSLELAEETIGGMMEIGAIEVAEIFQEALSIIKPHWPELESVSQSKTAHEWLEATGIEDAMKPLNDRMWKLFGQFGESGLMSVWAAHARKHPERCIVRSE